MKSPQHPTPPRPRPASTSSADAAAKRRYYAAAALREALRAFERGTENVARGHGLTSRSYQLLLMIKTGRERSGSATPDELEERLQLAKSTVTELINRSEERALIRRELHPHRRGRIRITLTRKGARQLERAFEDLGDERHRLLELVTDLPRRHRRDPQPRRRSPLLPG